MIHRKATDKKIQRAKKLRRRMTRAERAFWKLVKGERLGARFWCQAVLLGWIVDFYCPTRKLIIEIDGATHNSDEAREYDANRTLVLERELGVRIIRFQNRDVLCSPTLVEAQIRNLLG